MFKKLIEESTGKSPWLFHIHAGSCNGCDIELVSVLTPATMPSVWASSWRAPPAMRTLWWSPGR